MHKRLTVIIPGYNNPEEWWARCIESALQNIGTDDELICVDDGSLVAPRILEHYAQTDSRVRVVYCESNGGLSVARNRAMELARGEYLTFVDSDDELEPYTYEKALSAMVQTNSDVVVFGVRSIWVNEKLYKDNVAIDANLGCLNACDVKRLFDDCLLNYAWNKVYRSLFIKKHHLMFDPDGMPCEDIMFVLECVMSGAKWATIGHVGINYYKTHSSLLSRYKPSYVQGIKQASDQWKKYKEFDATARDVVGDLGEVSDRELTAGQWDNIWRIGSPYRLRDKWRFLNENRAIANGRNLCLFFIGQIIYSFCRKHFYFSQVQRWHIRRVYPDVRPLSEIEGS